MNKNGLNRMLLILGLGLCGWLWCGSAKSDSLPASFATVYVSGSMSGSDDAAQTALIEAVHANDLEAAKRLIALIADRKSTGEQCWAAFTVLVQEYRPDRFPLLRLLWQHGADAHMQSREGDGVWANLLQYRFNEIGDSSSLDLTIFKALLTVGLKVKTLPDGQLSNIAAHGDTPLLRLLVANGLDLKQEGGKALCVASHYGENHNSPIDTLLFLVDQGAYQPDDPDCRAFFRNVAWFGVQSLTMHMLARGAARHTSDLTSALPGPCGGASVLDMALPNRDVVNLLLRYGADPNGLATERGSPLFHALLLGPEGHEIVRILLKHGAVVNVRDEWGTTPLMVAATGDAEMVRLLLQKGANPNARAKDGRNPLSSTRFYEQDRQHGKGAIRRLLKQAGAKE